KRRGDPVRRTPGRVGGHASAGGETRMTSPNGPLYFQVTLSKQVAQETKELIKEASAAGLKDQVLRALREINDRLKKDANGFGEPRYDLKELGLQVRVGVVAPCAVYYGVNLFACRAFVTGLRLFGLS